MFTIIQILLLMGIAFGTLIIIGVIISIIINKIKIRAFNILEDLKRELKFEKVRLESGLKSIKDNTFQYVENSREEFMRELERIRAELGSIRTELGTMRKWEWEE